MLTLLYHNVLSAPADDLPVAAHQVTLATFRRHIHYFRKNLLHPLEAHEQLVRGKLPRGILVTFDDGAAGIVEAGQALAEAGAVGVAFICPGALHSGLWFYQLADALTRATVARLKWSRWDLPLTGNRETRTAYALLSGHLFDLAPVTRSACMTEIITALQLSPKMPHPALTTLDEQGLRKAVLTGGLIFANHSWSHPNLLKLSEPELNQEVQAAQDWLDRAGLPYLPWFAFPRGEHDGRVREIVSRFCPISFAATAQEREPGVLPRTYICELDANPVRFLAKTAWEGGFRRRFLSFGNVRPQPNGQLAQSHNPE